MTRPTAAERLARVTAPDRDFEGATRGELRDGPTGVELTLSGVTARVASLPLVRRDGAQAVRVALDMDRQIPRVSVVLEGNATTIDTGAGRTRSLLFVPSVETARAARVELEADGERTEATLELQPPRRWRVFLVHHSHLDIGYTDPQNLVLGHHLRYLDAVLDLAAATDEWPESARFRWNVETTWPLERWLAVRPRAARDELLRRVRQGRVEVCALPYSMHTEAYSIDELARTLRFADALRDDHGVEIVTAMQTDVPGAVPGLATLLTEAGVRYLAVAHNYAGRSVPYLHDGQDLQRPFWWRASTGGRLLVWMTDSPHGIAYMEGNLLGLAESADVAEELLPEYLAALAEKPYPYSAEHEWLGLLPGFEVTRKPYPYDVLHVRVQSVIADNAPPSLGPAEVVRAWNERWASPELRLATNREFFEVAEARLGGQLDEWQGEWADWWADGIGSAARAVGANRRAQGAIRTAQTLHTLADRLAEEETTWSEEIDRAYNAMGLFDEHTWGSGNPWSDELEQFESGALQWQRKVAFGQDAHDRVEALVESGAERLAHVFAAPSEALASVLVVNGGGRARTDLVRVFVPAGRAPIDVSFEVVTLEGERIPFLLEPQAHARFRPGGRWLSFVARDVPACGWARYDLVRGTGPSAAREPSSAVLDDGVLRAELDVDQGAVASLVDVASGRELVDGAGAFAFNGYVYDRYATAPRFNHLSSRVPAAARWMLGSRSLARHGTIVERTANDLWEQITFRLTADGCAFLESSYRLVRGLGRLDIANRLQKHATDDKESVYFTFPFALDGPRVEWEVTGGVAGEGRPHVPGSARHMRAIRHWALLSDVGGARASWATLEAPLVQLGNIHLPYRPFPPTVPAHEASRATVVSWAMNNLWDTNFPPAQGGETVFRYAVAPAAGRTDALALGSALATPLTGVTLARGSGTDSRARGSVLALDRDDVELVHLAPSRRGNDLVAFLHSHADEPVDVEVSFDDVRVARASIGTFLERNLRETGPRLRLEPGAFVSLSLDLERA
jgi:Glycosyl hydrolases family 38 N-terminal domain